jgi:hypothetical protein
MNSTPLPFYALLVGIDRYDPRSRVPHLRGCVTDVTQLARLLQDRFAAPADHIVQLTNEAATHAGIKNAFRTHLLAAAQQAAAAGTPATLLFHYSGHGSQATDETGTEPDGLDETLVPYDSRTPDVYDIKDWELGALIEELNAFSDNVTIILDCCHSGSGTRAADLPQTRRCPPDLRPQPPTSQRPTGARSTRTVGAGNWEIGGRHVLLAGCRDREEANEYAVATGAQRNWQGAMSYFLHHELQQLSPTQTVTYRELFERVRYAVNKTYSNQMPQCEGDIDRVLFGGMRPARDPFYTVIDQHNGLLWIDGGVAHGLTLDSELKVYAPETRTVADAEELATLRVVEEGAVTSGCEPLEANATVPLYARCTVHRLNPAAAQRRVTLAIADETLRRAVQARLRPTPPPGALDVSPWLVAVGDGVAADFRVTQLGDQLAIEDATGKLLVAPFTRTDLDGLAGDLAHLARYQNALALRNLAPSELADTVSVTVKRLTFDAGTRGASAAPLEQMPGGELVVEAGERVVIEVTNRSDQPLYFAIFDFSPDWAISQIYPTIAGAHEALQPGGVFAFGLTSRRRAQLQAQLPPNMAEAVERFKVIATVHETDFALLQQSELKTPFMTRAVQSAGLDAEGNERPPSALDQLLGQTMNGNPRAFRIPPATVADEWTTAECAVLVVEAAGQMTRALAPGAPTSLPGYGITVEAPPAFTGSVRILTAQQATRAALAVGEGEVPSPTIPVPPGLASHPELFQPLPLGNRRAAQPLGAVLELEADDQARRTVSADTPLTLHFEATATAEGPLLAVAYENGLFYAVGHSTGDRDIVTIDWLPTADGDGAEAGTELAGRRALGRVLKLYLYKMAGWIEPSLGLHRVQYLEPEEAEWTEIGEGEFLREFDGGALLYSPIDASDILPRQRIAVAVHGFSADSQGLATWLTNVLPKTRLAYDHVLTYDYESFATGISENGRKLADALREVEVDVRPRVRVDIFAHSMGTLVTRSMVELWGGAAFVNRCFLAGPPNQGTRLAEVKKLAPWLATLALNGLGGWTPAVIAEWLLGKLEADAIGLDDLRPSATLLNDLNVTTKAATVPYYLLVGTNALLPQQDATLMQRLQRQILQGVDLALDTIFADQNDMVINVRSMVGLRNGNYPGHLLQQAEVPCHHFNYFTDPTAVDQLLRWLG